MKVEGERIEQLNHLVTHLYRKAYEGAPVDAIAFILPSVISKTQVSLSCVKHDGSLQTYPQIYRDESASGSSFAAATSHRRNGVGTAEGVDVSAGAGAVVGCVCKACVHRQWLHDEDVLQIEMELGNGSTLRTLITRARQPFTEEEIFLLNLMIPHMCSILEMSLKRAPAPVKLNTAESLKELGLTRREQEVLYWISEGKTNAEAADILGIASGTVRIHLLRIYQKLGVENRHGATRKALDKLYPGRF